MRCLDLIALKVVFFFMQITDQQSDSVIEKKMKSPTQENRFPPGANQSA